MLSAEEVAPLLNTTLRWVYAHADKLGGKHHLGAAFAPPSRLSGDGRARMMGDRPTLVQERGV